MAVLKQLCPLANIKVEHPSLDDKLPHKTKKLLRASLKAKTSWLNCATCFVHRAQKNEVVRNHAIRTLTHQVRAVDKKADAAAAQPVPIRVPKKLNPEDSKFPSSTLYSTEEGKDKYLQRREKKKEKQRVQRVLAEHYINVLGPIYEEGCEGSSRDNHKQCADCFDGYADLHVRAHVYRQAGSVRTNVYLDVAAETLLPDELLKEKKYLSTVSGYKQWVKALGSILNKMDKSSHCESSSKSAAASTLRSTASTSSTASSLEALLRATHIN